jgi:hypothetical protein
MRAPYRTSTSSLRYKGSVFDGENAAYSFGGIFLETSLRHSGEDSQEANEGYISYATEDLDDSYEDSEASKEESEVHVETYLNVNVGGLQHTGGEDTNYAATEDVGQVRSPEVKHNVGVEVGVGVGNVMGS